MLLAGTKWHLTDLDRGYAYIDDASVTDIAVGLGRWGPYGPEREVSRPAWALLDRQRIVSVEDAGAPLLLELPRPTGARLAVAVDGMLVIGFEDAHLATIGPDGELDPLPTCEAMVGQDRRTAPDSRLGSLRALTICDEDRWYVAVDRTGLWRSADRGRSWANLLPAEAQVNDVVTVNDPVTRETSRVAVATTGGFGWSDDSGDTWQWVTAGLWTPSCFAVALDDDWAYVVDSTDSTCSDCRVYRS